jgi:hypothetical protein
MNRESIVLRWATRALLALACLAPPGAVSAQTAATEPNGAAVGGAVQGGQSVPAIVLFTTPDGRQFAIVCEGDACDNVVWGNDAYLDDDNVVWGNDAYSDSDNVVWGNDAYFGSDNVVWGNDPYLDADNVVWGNDADFDSDSDNVVWGNDAYLESPNVVWGNVTVVFLGWVW